jgi:hypothetical protein
MFAVNLSIYIFVVFIKYEKSRDENGLETESGGSSPLGGVGPLLAMPPCGETTSELTFVLVFSCDFVSMFNFRLYTPWIAQGLYIMFSSCFCFDLFLSGVVLSFRGIMTSASNDKGKKPLEEDHQDPKLKEGQMTG